MLAILICLLTVMVHIVPYAQEMNVSPTRAASVLSTIAGVSMAGRFVSGIAIDRVGSKRVIIFCFILLIAGLLWLQIATELWMLYLFAVVYGVAHGGFFTAFSPLIAEFFGIKFHGALFGITMFSGNLGGASGPVMAGYIFDITGAYAGAIWICTAVSILGFLLVVLLKPLAAGGSGDAH
jgi:MFS family permease